MDAFPQFGHLRDRDDLDKRILEVADMIRSESRQRDAVPFDPWYAAALAGLRVRERALPGGVSGVVHATLRAPEIELQSRDGRARRRFSLAHEIGHLCFRDCDASLAVERATGVLNNDTVGRREEWICDRLAAELLMPDRLFRPRAAESQPNRAGIAELARDFGVSAEAALTRGAELQIWPLARIGWFVSSEKKASATRVRHYATPPTQSASERSYTFRSLRQLAIEAEHLVSSFDRIAELQGFNEIRLSHGTLLLCWHQNSTRISGFAATH